MRSRISYGSYTPSEIDRALRVLHGETSIMDGTWSWTQVARKTAQTIGKSLMYRETDIEEAYQNAIELTTALNNRQGKAIPVRLRGIIGTVDRVATTLRDLYRLTKNQSIEDMDEAMGRLLSFRMRWRQLLEFTGIKKVQWIKALLIEARTNVLDKVQRGQLSSRFET